MELSTTSGQKGERNFLHSITRKYAILFVTFFIEMQRSFTSAFKLICLRISLCSANQPVLPAVLPVSVKASTRISKNVKTCLFSGYVTDYGDIDVFVQDTLLSEFVEMLKKARFNIIVSYVK